MSTESALTPDRIEPLTGVYRNGLPDDTVPFWFPCCVDDECGGFMVARNRDDSLLDDDKGVWQQGRATPSSTVVTINPRVFGVERRKVSTTCGMPSRVTTRPMQICLQSDRLSRE